MQEELFRFLEERELKKTRHTMYFYREVPVYDMIPDILAFASSHIEAYELKLKACKKLHEQGIKVCRGFNRAYIVLPNEIEAEKMKKYRGEYGIYSFDGEKLKRIKMHNSVNDIKEPYDERHRLIIKFDAMNAVVRGFFVGGVNEQMKAGRPASRD
jgi:hypothetical protein